MNRKKGGFVFSLSLWAITFSYIFNFFLFFLHFFFQVLRYVPSLCVFLRLFFVYFRYIFILEQMLERS
ncbi:hypothetical protein EDC96DRAFT_500894, partial [Choanephora cucurbitarum]